MSQPTLEELQDFWESNHCGDHPSIVLKATINNEGTGICWICSECLKEEEEFEKNEEDCDIENLLYDLNHGDCYGDGRHPKTNDADWELLEDAYHSERTEEVYNRISKRLEERKKNGD